MRNSGATPLSYKGRSVRAMSRNQATYKVACARAIFSLLAARRSMLVRLVGSVGFVVLAERAGAAILLADLVQGRRVA